MVLDISEIPLHHDFKNVFEKPFEGSVWYYKLDVIKYITASSLKYKDHTINTVYSLKSNTITVFKFV